MKIAMFNQLVATSLLVYLLICLFFSTER